MHEIPRGECESKTWKTPACQGYARFRRKRDRDARRRRQSPTSVDCGCPCGSWHVVCAEPPSDCLQQIAPRAGGRKHTDWFWSANRLGTPRNRAVRAPKQRLPPSVVPLHSQAHADSPDRRRLVRRGLQKRLRSATTQITGI